MLVLQEPSSRAPGFAPACMVDERGRATGEAEGAACGVLPWNKRLWGAAATRDGCCMVDERGRATGEAEGAACGALP